MIRKLFAILLLCILPLASAYSAVGSVCAHEAAEAGKKMHFGHHAHVHHASASGTDDGRGPVPGQVDVDCPVCHAFGVKLLSAVNPLLLDPTLDRFFSSLHSGHRSAELEGPEHRDKPRLA